MEDTLSAELKLISDRHKFDLLKKENGTVEKVDIEEAMTLLELSDAGVVAVNSTGQSDGAAATQPRDRHEADATAAATGNTSSPATRTWRLSAKAAVGFQAGIFNPPPPPQPPPRRPVDSHMLEETTADLLTFELAKDPFVSGGAHTIFQHENPVNAAQNSQPTAHGRG